jgi:cytochrome c-type biogenesis protein CcmE
MTTGIKLAVGGFIVAAVTGYMAYQGAASSWQYYLTVDECIAASDNLGESRLRVHGSVVPGSLQIAPDRHTARFEIAGERGKLKVIAPGPIPDNLKEEVEVVVEGRLSDSETLHAEQVLTKCASKYQSQTPPSEPNRFEVSQVENGP